MKLPSFQEKASNRMGDVETTNYIELQSSPAGCCGRLQRVTSGIRSLTREQILAAVFGFLSYFLVCVCISMPAPFLPMESELHGQVESITGLMLGFMPLLQTFLNPVWGKLAVHIGVKKLLNGGMFVSGTMTAAFGCIEFIPHTHTTAYTLAGFSIRAVQAAGCAAIFTTVFILITDLFPKHNTLMLSLTGALGGVGVMGGPAIGAGLFALGGFWIVFVGVGGFMVVISMLMCIFLPSHNAHEDKKSNTKLPYRKILLNPRTLVSLAVGYFSAMKWAAIDPILEPELRGKYGMDQEHSALIFLILSASYVIATPIAGKTVGQPFCIGSLWVMIIGLTISMCAFLFAGPSPLLQLTTSDKELWLLLTCLVVMGMTNCLLYVPAQDITFKLERLDLPSDVNLTAVRGLLSGCWNSAYSLGTFSGMALSGTLTQYCGWPWTMTTYAIGCLIFIFIILAILVKEKSVICCPSRHTVNNNEEEERKLLSADSVGQDYHAVN